MIHSAMTPGVAAASWPFVENFIKQAVVHAHGDFTERFIARELANGRMQLWTSFDKEQGLIACAVSSIEELPAQKVCFIHCVAGNSLESVVELEPHIIDWARKNGAVALEGVGRKGFAKKLPPGWHEVYRTYRKQIGN